MGSVDAISNREGPESLKEKTLRKLAELAGEGKVVQVFEGKVGTFREGGDLGGRATGEIKGVRSSLQSDLEKLQKGGELFIVQSGLNCFLVSQATMETFHQAPETKDDKAIAGGEINSSITFTKVKGENLSEIMENIQNVVRDNLGDDSTIEMKVEGVEVGGKRAPVSDHGGAASDNHITKDGGAIDGAAEVKLEKGDIPGQQAIDILKKAFTSRLQEKKADLADMKKDDQAKSQEIKRADLRSHISKSEIKDQSLANMIIKISENKDNTILNEVIDNIEDKYINSEDSKDYEFDLDQELNEAMQKASQLQVDEDGKVFLPVSDTA